MITSFLTLVVSLEPIFLSTFVLIGQNRQAALQQAKADHDFHESETELKVNTDLTRAIHTMTRQIQTLVEDVQHAVVATSAQGHDGGQDG